MMKMKLMKKSMIRNDGVVVEEYSEQIHEEDIYHMTMMMMVDTHCGSKGIPSVVVVMMVLLLHASLLVFAVMT